MMQDNFRNLYIVAKTMVEQKDEILCRILAEADVIKDIDVAQLENEIKTAQEILDAWEPPVLPFDNVTDEMIEKDRKVMEEQYGFVIISSMEYGTDEDCARRVKDDPDYFLGMSEDEVRYISNEAYGEDRQLIMEELGNAYTKPVVIIGYVERWNGKIPVCRSLDSIVDIFERDTGDELTLYVKDRQLRMDVTHHDGTNSYTVYKFREGHEDMVDTPEDSERSAEDKVMLRLESIVPDLVKYFGWQLNKEDNKNETRA